MAKGRIKDRRRVNDYYTQKAKKENFPARSVYKLEEIDQKHHLLKNGYKVLDLGCAPGSWLLYASQKVGPGGLIIGIDLQEVSGVFEPNTRIVQGDVLELTPELVEKDGPFDLVLSDMAPKTTGNRIVDQAGSERLCRAAMSWAESLLKPKGVFLFKVFQGPDLEQLVSDVKTRFKVVKRVKPKSSRSFSTELFVLGLDFLGRSIQ